MNAVLARRVLVEKRAWIIPIGASLVLNLGAYLGYIYPLRGQVQAAEAREDAARQSLAIAQRDYQAARSLIFGKDQAQGELQTFYRDVLPTDLAGARRITYARLQQIARDANLRDQRSVFEPKEPRDSLLRKLEITLVVEGSYESIRQFMYRIETAKEFIVIDNLALTQGAEISSPLVLTLSLSTYFRPDGS